MDLQKELVEAAGRGDEDQVLSLLSQGAEIRDFGALHKAVYHGQVDMVRFLMSHGANIEEREPQNSYSVLIYAIEQGQKDVIEVLLNLGANVHKSSKGMTPLHKAVFCNKPEIVAILLKHGANVNATYYSSLNTPLHYSSRYGNSEIVKLFVSVPGIKINAMNGDFQTPLHVATEKNHIETVRLLLHNGADANLRDKNGKTAFDLCSDLVPVLSDEIKSFQLAKQENREVQNQNRKLKKMLEETKKREVELEKEVDELKRQLKRKEESEDREKIERVVEMETKIFEAVVGRLTTDLNLLYKETERRSSQLREDETSLKDSIRDVKDRISQLEASSGRVGMSEKVESLEGEVTGVKIEVLSLQMALARHFDSSAKDIIALTKLWKNENSSGACANNIREVKLVQVASEMEEDGVDHAQQDQTKDTELNNFESKDIEKNKSNNDLEFERNEVEREKVSDTVEIVGVRETEGENVARLVQSLSLWLGTITDDVKEVKRTSNDVIEVQFLNVESARSWLMAFEEKKEQVILAYDLNRSLDKIEISVNRKLSNYDREIDQGQD